ncbi:MAG: hypothetical protein WDO56_36000 [Gammaproteobacteria bacterium]
MGDQHEGEHLVVARARLGEEEVVQRFIVADHGRAAREVGTD